MFQTSYFNKSYSEFKSALESYDKNFKEDLFVKAIEVAENSHKDQFRASGDPYIIHPYEVCKSLIELKLDNTEIITQNDLENNLAENKFFNFNQTNTEKLNLPLSNSKQSASLSDNKQNFLETVSLSILFENEVWIEVDNTEEILISQVFKEGEELNLEVSKNDEIFVTSGNMGLISIKVNNGQIKFLGSIGEIGRKQIF